MTGPYEVNLWPKGAESRRHFGMDPLGDTRWVNHLLALAYAAGSKQAEAELARYMPHYLAGGGHDGWLARQAAAAPYFWLGAEADPEA